MSEPTLCRYRRFKKPRYCTNARSTGFRTWNVLPQDLILYKEWFDDKSYHTRLARVLGLATHDGCGKEYMSDDVSPDADETPKKLKPSPRLAVLAASDMLDHGYERHVRFSDVMEVLRYNRSDYPWDFGRWFLLGKMPPSPELAYAAADYGIFSNGFITRYLSSPEGELLPNWREISRQHWGQPKENKDEPEETASRSTSPVFDMNKYLECPNCGAVAVERTHSTLRSKPDNFLCVNCGEYHGTSVSGPFAEGAR
jgi:predicted RNA-binding Zn-ribbon protein involved in translation (DUF1610 family)